jgi:hypothetical protein
VLAFAAWLFWRRDSTEVRFAGLCRNALLFDNLVVVIGILKECRWTAVSSRIPEAFSQGEILSRRHSLLVV